MRVSAESGLTHRVAHGPNWRQISRGLFLPVDLPDLGVEQRIVEASMICPTDGAITGWAALRWLRGLYFSGTYADQELPITLAIGRRHIRERPGIEVSAEQVLPQEIVEVDGVRVTVPVFSATFEARHAENGIDAVRALDMAMMFDLTSTDELVDFTLRRLFTTTGIAQLHAAICLASENSWSPLEPIMRVLWEVELRLERQLLCNWPVFDRDGRHIGTPDLIDPVAGVAGEYNGAPHLGQEARDADRAAEFRDVGLEVVTMTVDDLPWGHSFLDRLEAAYYRAERRAHRPRRWTTALPAYWVPTHTVAHRRALDAEQRERFLTWQRLAARPADTPVLDVAIEGQERL
jgi:hypothetical protein